MMLLVNIAALIFFWPALFVTVPLWLILKAVSK